MDDDPATTTIACAARSYRVDVAKVRRLADRIKATLGVGGYDLSVSFVGARRIRTLNKMYRGKDKSTDVLSFPQVEWRAPLIPKQKKIGLRFRTSAASVVRGSAAVYHGNAERRRRGKAFIEPHATLGDLIVSLPDAARNARRIGQPLDREVCFLLVHGILHLCGHDHIQPDDERRMLAAQRRIMSKLGAGGATAWHACVRPPRGGVR